MKNSEKTIYFNFSYFALNLLGKGLYSNPWTAISELVANGIDAQASCVKIYINIISKENAVIEIFDNGYGMDYSDLSQKYVLIGKDKRNDDELSEEIKKQLMGRKGIGKLAALYLSNKYYLISKTNYFKETAWCLDTSNVNESDIPHLDRVNVENISIECLKEWRRFSTGTMLHLTNVNLTNFGYKSIEGLKARLADFYLLDFLPGKIEVCVRENNYSPINFESIEKSIAFKNFYAFFNNTDTSFDDRLSKEVIFKNSIPEIEAKKRKVVKLNIENFNKVHGYRYFRKSDGNLTDRELEYKMSGWIGIHSSINKEDAILNDPDYLKNKVYRPNQLRLYVRKKLAVENFLEYIKNTQAFSNYIEGEISFDILDDNELGDIATSNRQGFIEDDERVQLLVEILKPIINSLIKERINIANQINNDVKEYNEKREKIEREKREKAELEKEQVLKEKSVIEEENKIQKEKVYNLTVDLKSEKKRNVFLMDNIDDTQINFLKRLHMLKINIFTMQTLIKNSILKLQRGKLNEEDIWNYLKKISYLLSRIKAVLEYSAIAKFNTSDEYITGDIFSFVKEYCEKVVEVNNAIKIRIKIIEREKAVIRFVPQDLVIIIDNIVSNSVKHNARNLQITLKDNTKEIFMEFADDGNGVESNISNLEELFEFGKSYTSTGTGIGLYHIKDIVENKLNGSVKIPIINSTGFILQIRMPKDEI